MRDNSLRELQSPLTVVAGSATDGAPAAGKETGRLLRHILSISLLGRYALELLTLPKGELSPTYGPVS